MIRQIGGFFWLPVGFRGDSQVQKTAGHDKARNLTARRERTSSRCAIGNLHSGIRPQRLVCGRDCNGPAFHHLQIKNKSRGLSGNNRHSLGMVRQ